MPGVGRGIGGALDAAGDSLNGLSAVAQREANRVLELRDQKLARMLRQNRDLIERDANGNLARRGELLVTGPTANELAALQRVGFSVITEELVEGLDLAIVRLGVPAGLSLARAEAFARKAAPEAEIAVDNLHWQSGAPAAQGGAMPMPALLAAPNGASIDTPIGIIDCAPGLSQQRLRSLLEEIVRQNRFDRRRFDELLAASNGHRGVGRLRTALADLGDLAPFVASGLEIRFLELIRAAGLPEPGVNVVVAGERVDFHWATAGLVVEIDSWRYHRSRRSFEDDRRRANVFALAGLTLLRITDARIDADASGVVADVAAALGVW